MTVVFLTPPVSISLSEHDAWQLRKLCEQQARVACPEWQIYWLSLAWRLTQALEAYYQRRLSRTALG